ncbi:phosphopantetheine-binding protein [Streptomyces sp. NPDC051840]|uniref:phosphopantetheine-binding protein n=1 Tax=unclassified Streptomyces TaxID=2593676 RepID=UPI00342BCD86
MDTTETEQILVRCASVLGVEKVSAHDDFYGVGGDSLDAAELSEVLTADLGKEVGMETIMRSPTFGDMIKELRR